MEARQQPIGLRRIPAYHRRRKEPAAVAGRIPWHVFEAEVVPMLKAAPGVRPVAIFEEILRRHPELGAQIRRTLERRIRAQLAVSLSGS
ncbi:hypothetical protein ACVWXO_001857 [Bradyrhizobium sp. LM2.7]